MGKKEKDKKEVILFFPQKEMSLKCLSHRQSTQNVLLLSQWLNAGVFMHSQLLRNLRLNPQTAFFLTNQSRLDLSGWAYQEEDELWRCGNMERGVEEYVLFCFLILACKPILVKKKNYEM